MSKESVLRWAVIGVGRAGQARARAIQAHRGCELVAVYRGRFAERFPTIPAAGSFSEALAVADAVAICSPDVEHPGQVEQALRAGKHVVCEYPVAADAREALRLLGFAHEVGRVLHVEHIELLHAPQATLRAHMKSDPAVEIRQEFTRTGDETADPEEVAVRNLARVHRLIDLAGSVIRVQDLKLEPGSVSGQLIHAAGATSNFMWQQSAYLKRATRMSVRTRSRDEWRLDRDTLYRGKIAQTLIESKPLFEQDHRIAMARIRDARGPYVEDPRLVHGLQVMRRIAEGREGDVGTA